MMRRSAFRPILKGDTVAELRQSAPRLLDALHKGRVFVYDEDSDGYEVFIVGSSDRAGKGNGDLPHRALSNVWH